MLLGYRDMYALLMYCRTQAVGVTVNRNNDTDASIRLPGLHRIRVLDLLMLKKELYMRRLELL